MVSTVTGVADRLWPLFSAYLEAEGVELDDLDVRGGGKARYVRVYVDAPEGVGVDRIAELSRGLSRVLDEEDPISGSYTLEVSSPGLERELRRPRHFEKSIGREVDVRTSSEVAGASHHRGTLVTVAADAIGLQIDDEVRQIPSAEITKAQTVFRWEKAPKPGGERGKK